jgi:protein associated with RNAse G/E
MSVVVVKDAPQEIMLSVFPGAECMDEEHYASGVKNGIRRWDFRDKDWQLKKVTWHTNRVLSIAEPGKYYSILLFWNHASNEFSGYYVNFQLPLKRSHCGFDSLDLDLDMVINPDFSFEWKDVDDYQKATEHGLIIPQWVQGIEKAKAEIFEKLEKRQYPFNGSWLDWKPNPSWQPPKLPENWDKI